MSNITLSTQGSVFAYPHYRVMKNGANLGYVYRGRPKGWWSYQSSNGRHGSWCATRKEAVSLVVKSHG
jgi:hypothetical protein